MTSTKKGSGQVTTARTPGTRGSSREHHIPARFKSQDVPMVSNRPFQPTDRFEPEPSTIDEYTCPVEGCTFHILAAGPVDIDEDDPFQEEVDAHRRTHESPKTVGDVGVTGLWLAMTGVVPDLLEALISVVNTPATDVARALRDVADVLDRAAR